MDMYGQNVNLMLMANTLQFKNADSIERVFDIKGSKVKRDVKCTAETQKTSILKDINFIRLTDKSPSFVNFLQGDVNKINSLIKRDVLFLKSHNIMDFSLLFAIEKFTYESLSFDTSEVKTNSI